MKRIRWILGNLCFVAAVAALILYVFSVAQGNSPAIFGYRILRVVSSSMQPTIPDETCILIHEVEAETLKVGDIITFRSVDPVIYGYYNTHRIYDVYEDEAGGLHFLTKGDANEYPDDYEVLPEYIVGKYIKQIPFGKVLAKALNGLNNRYVYFLVVILPLVLCLISYVWQLLCYAWKKDEEEDKEE